jgi:hypothetical protein
MTEKEKLLRDIEGLKESIRFEHMDLANLSLTPAEKAGLRRNIDFLTGQLKELLARLDRPEDE